MILTNEIYGEIGWNEEMYQYLGSGRQKPHAEDGKTGRQEQPDSLTPCELALQALGYVCLPLSA